MQGPRPISAPDTMLDDRQRKANLRLGLILATVAIVFAIGFVARMAWFGH